MRKENYCCWTAAPVTNFEAEGSSADFAAKYAKDGLAGGHVIMLGPGNEEAALAALEQIVIRRDKLQKHLVRLEGDTLTLVPPTT